MVAADGGRLIRGAVNQHPGYAYDTQKERFETGKI
jgi:hypothetical protein